MARRTRSHLVRPAAISASTVFGITLAVIAGLIAAWVVKKVVLDPKQKVVAAPPETVKVTVAAENLTDKMYIQAKHLKKVTMSKADYDRWLAKAKERQTDLLKGNQPLGRVTKVPLRAEEPIFEADLDPNTYPPSVGELIGPGKRGVIVEVPWKNTMLQVGDHVDVMCTLSNDSPLFGKGKTATARIAEDAKVVARFNSTRKGQLPAPGKLRTFTLEVTPRRYAMIELAKALKANFSLSVRDKAAEASGDASPSPPPPDDMEQRADLVTSKDIALLFGITDALPDRVFEIERYVGVKQQQSLRYQFPDQPGGQPQGQPAPAPAPGKQSPPPAGRVSRNDSPGGGGATINADGAFRAAGWRRLDSPGAVPGNNGGGAIRVAAAGREAGAGLAAAQERQAASGFRAPAAAGKKDCPTCQGRK